MPKEDRSRGSGGKLTRSETVTVRLDPKLRYLAELAALKHRRTLSSFVEWAIEDSLQRVKLREGTGYNSDTGTTVSDDAESLWDVDDADRFAKLALKYPELLTPRRTEALETHTREWPAVAGSFWLRTRVGVDREGTVVDPRALARILGSLLCRGTGRERALCTSDLDAEATYQQKCNHSAD